MKIKEKIKSNVKPIAAFMMGAVIFGSIAGVVATTLAASEIAFTPQDSTWNVTTVKGAMDDLYTRQNKYNALLDYSKVTGSGITYKYSNTEQNGVAYNTELAGAVTTNSGFNNGYSYLRTTYINNTAIGHSACLKYNDREFCIEPNYWACPISISFRDCGLKTKAKLQAAMEAALGVSADSCASGSASANCVFGSAYCRADYDGDVSCEDASGYAYVVSDGSADFGSSDLSGEFKPEETL